MALSHKELEALAKETVKAVKDYVDREIAEVRSASAFREAALEQRIHELEARLSQIEEHVTRPEATS